MQRHRPLSGQKQIMTIDGWEPFFFFWLGGAPHLFYFIPCIRNEYKSLVWKWFLFGCVMSFVEKLITVRGIKDGEFKYFFDNIQ